MEKQIKFVLMQIDTGSEKITQTDMEKIKTALQDGLSGLGIKIVLIPKTITPIGKKQLTNILKSVLAAVDL